MHVYTKTYHKKKYRCIHMTIVYICEIKEVVESIYILGKKREREKPILLVLPHVGTSEIEVSQYTERETKI